MKAGCLVLVLVLVLAGTARAQEATGLSRLTTREDLRGFEPVGRVDIEGGGFCTGALIAADLVLTAAHCVVDPDGTPVPADRISFRAGLSDGRALVEARVARTVIDPAYRPISPAPPEMIRRDVALMQLSDPIPTTQIPPFAVALPGRGDKVGVVSYADGRTEALAWQPVCNVLARQEGLIAVDCDVSFGSSGAPVLDRSAGYRAKIVSIISVGSTWDGRRVAVGMELPEVVAGLKAALRAGRVASEAAPTRAPERRVGKKIAVGESGDTGARFVRP
jgi:protease YdgD